MADIKFGLNVNRSLADVADPAAALENIGIDINDLDVIRNAAGDLGITADDVKTLSGLNVPVQTYLVKLYQDTLQYSTIIDETAGTGSVLKGNLSVNGALGAGAIKYQYIDDDNSTLKFADISTSRVSSWSSTDSPATDTSPIFYGSTIEIDGAVEANTLEILKPADTVRFRSSEVPTHKVQATINGQTVYLYAMKGIPLVFEGFFRNLDSDLRLVTSGAVSWRVVNNQFDYLTKEYENVGGSNTTRSFLRYRDTGAASKNVEIYHNPNNILTLPMSGIGLEKLPAAALENCQNLYVNNNIIKTFPDFTQFVPNVRLLDVRENNFTLGDEPTLRKFNSSVLARIPTTVREIRFGNTFNGSITADLTTLTNLLTLNLNGHNRGGAFNYFDQDAEDPSGAGPEVSNTCQNYYLYRNSFNEIPQSVKDLPDLRQINIYSNSITDDSMSFASSVINYINIGGNPGINIPNLTNKNSLQNFYAHYNSAANVPADRNLFTTSSGAYKFANCGSLRLIYCYGSAYTGPIPKFAGNSQLYYFQGQYTALRGGRSDTEQDYVLYDDVFDDCADAMRYFQVASSSLLNAPMHPDCFEKPTGMIGIVFRSFNAGVSGAFPSLNTMQNLRYIVMLQNNFTGPLPNFFNNPNLYYCHLYGNQFSGNIPVIQSNALQYFYVHSNQLTGFAGLETPNLRRLFISYNLITGAVPDMNNLVLCYDFYMNNNNFTDYTAGALIACRSLYRFDISNNPNLPAGAVNSIVADLVANYENNPRGGISVNLANTSIPTGDAVEQIEFLRSKGWNMRL